MKKSAGIFVLVCLCIVLTAVIAVYGIQAFGLPGVFEDDAIRKGLDLVGGSSIVYQAEVPEGKEIDNLEEDMRTVQAMLRQRLDAAGYTEGTVARVGDDRFRVEIPGISNPEEAVQKLGSTAKLEFVDSNGNVVLTGDDIEKATAVYTQAGSGLSQEHLVTLQLKPEAVKKFADATEEMSKLQGTGKNYIAIQLDGTSISVPFVNSRIESETCQIEGNFEQDEALWLANLISAGKLPLVLRDIELRSVGPTLGLQAFDSSVMAGAIGIVLVMLFMILIYRLNGLLSAITLVSYISIIGIILVAGKVNLSLPGIAGIILTIGMAVDSSVIIFERIREELNLGRSLRSSVKSGFSRAFTAILDANVTTLIAAAVLWYFGSGTIQGFAITLFIGVVVSLFTTLVVTRLLLTSVVGMNVKNVWLFGAKRGAAAEQGRA